MTAELRFVVCFQEARVGMKREEFNKPFSHHLHLVMGKDSAKFTKSLLKAD